MVVEEEMYPLDITLDQVLYTSHYSTYSSWLISMKMTDNYLLVEIIFCVGDIGSKYIK